MMCDGKEFNTGNSLFYKLNGEFLKQNEGTNELREYYQQRVAVYWGQFVSFT